MERCCLENIASNTPIQDTDGKLKPAEDCSSRNLRRNQDVRILSCMIPMEEWQTTLDGDTLLLRNLRTKETGQLNFEAARPAGEIRSTPKGDLIAVLVTDKQGTAWRFYEFRNGALNQMELPDSRASAIGKK